MTRNALTAAALAALLTLLLPITARAQLDPTTLTPSNNTQPQPATPTRFETREAALDHFLAAAQREETDAMAAATRLADDTRLAPDSRRRILRRTADILRRFAITPAALGQRLESRETRNTPDLYQTSFTTTAGETEVTYTLRFTLNPDRGWLIDARDEQAINDTFDALGLEPVANLLRQLELNEFVDQQTLGLRHYQWIGLAVILFIAVVIDFLAYRIAFIIGARNVKPTDTRDPKETRKHIARTAKPVALAIAATSAYILLPALSLPNDAHDILRLAARFLATLAGVLATYRITDVAASFFQTRAAITSNKFDDLLIPLLRKTAKLAVIAFGLLLIAESFSLPIASLLAGLGIGGLAFAFAAKDTIENLFGSVAVILDRPFNVGDWVIVDGNNATEGIVESLGFRSTRIRTFYNSLITVPNSTLVRAYVDNLGRRTYRRYRTVLNLTYSTPPDKIEEFCEGIRELVRQQPETRKDYYEIHMNDFGPHSLDILVYIFFRVPDWSAELKARHTFCLNVVRLAHKVGVEFAYPTQTLHLGRIDPPAQYDGRLPDFLAQRDGRDAASAILEVPPPPSKKTQKQNH